MPNFLCLTCGTQFAETVHPPARCPICQDERQYVGLGGQRWTTLEQLAQDHRNAFRQLEPGLHELATQPKFAIGQRALLLQTEAGNLLWDCLSLLDEATVSRVLELGGVRAIAISHPHYYASMVAWAEAFGAEIYLHAADQAHVMRPGPALRFWEGERLGLFGGLTLIRAGGHFEGGAVLHWPEGAAGQGALLSGDVIQVVQDTRWVSFMYSYPNLIPLGAAKVRGVVAAVEPFAFERIYGAFDRDVVTGAKTAVSRSAQRYIRALQGEL